MSRGSAPPLRRAWQAGALALAAAILFSACRARHFLLSGTVTIATPLRERALRSNSVLFIVVKNLGGVPLAVRRVVNPEFPVFFTLGDPDLLLPGAIPDGPFVLEVEMNSRGDVGSPHAGDLEGQRRDPVPAGSRHADAVINQVAR